MQLSFLERKERIVLTTIDVMNECGMHNVSTREIAKREGITEAAIFKHFPKKYNLYLAVLEYFSKYDNTISESIETKNLNPIDAIIFYVDMYSTYYENYPAITVILHSFDELRYNKQLGLKVNVILDARFNFFKQYIIKAQEIGDISKKYDADILTNIFIGTIKSINFDWRRINYNFSLKEKSLLAINILIEGFKENKMEE
ncbi:MAG: TetR/AcrR family transcriptional regulator [Pleomorphochaeta sp.]